MQRAGACRSGPAPWRVHYARRRFPANQVAAAQAPAGAQVRTSAACRSHRSHGGGGAAPWVAFLAGIVIVALVGLGIAAYTGNLQPGNDTAQLEVNLPGVKVNPPDVDLPDLPPAPQVPPSAEPVPAEPTTP